MENIDKVVWSRIWILLLPIIAALWFLTNSPSWAQNNRCDVFQIFHELDGDELTVKLETDCPESSTLMVSIDRVYDVNDGIAYSEPYLNEKSTVGKWKQPQIIDVSHATWRTTLTETRELMSRLGEKYEIGAIEDNIEISMVIPIPVAKDLVGEAVIIDEDWGKPLVEDSTQVYFPLTGKTAFQERMPSLNPYALEVGVIYEIRKETLLLPEQDPNDPSKPLGTSKAIRLQLGVQFKILEVSYKYGNLPTKYGDPWYRVVLISKINNKRSVSGWIYSLSWGFEDLQLVN